jgi:hypothetical protein
MTRSRGESLLKVEVQMPAKMQDKVLQATWMSGFTWGAVLVLLLFVVFGRGGR